ncbi:hypothetical protein KNE206_12620 [Kitasatospora sp. NE20-6]|uniref:hypothetical protein n=1 Tax=Kitasatospora sp. NE20-6 TaxID=2859066 RepID=UPI0034DC35CD
MTVQELGPTAADVQLLRTELDELLRARQYAAQREGRLAEAVGAAREPDRAHGYAQPQRFPDPELLRQLAQARTLREGLGVRCLELSERLLAVEDGLRQRGAAWADGQHGAAAPEAVPDRPAAVERPAAAPRRRRPTGARFGGVYEEEADQESTAAVAAPVAAPAAPARGARFGGVRPAADTVPEPSPQSPSPQGPPPVEAAAPVPRSAEELAGLAQRIGELHRRGSTHESAAVVAQAAVTLAPRDVARLASALRSRGPHGSAGYLARAAAHGPARQAADTLAELRRTGLTDEAAELFHALWRLPAAALPELLAALEATGQAADGHTLLWEWASAPPAELASLAARLSAAGRTGDVFGLLRQTAGRPVADVVAAVGELGSATGGPEGAQLALALVGEVAALRSAADLAELGAALVRWPVLYGALLAGVAALDESRTRSALAALRSVGLPTVPAAAGRSRGRR